MEKRVKNWLNNRHACRQGGCVEIMDDRRQFETFPTDNGLSQIDQITSKLNDLF